MPRHDPHLTPLTNDPRTVPSNHPRLALTFQRIHDLDLVALRNTLGDGDDQLDLVLDGFDDSVGCERWGDVDDGGVGLGVGDGVPDGAEDREAEVFGAGFLGGRGQSGHHG